MALGSKSGRSLWTGLAQFDQTILGLTFPLVLLSLCGVSYLLGRSLPTPEFGLWAWLALRAIHYAETNIAAAIGLGILVLSALPLAWLALRQREARWPKTIGECVVAVIVCGFTLWLRTVWPYDDSDRQIFAYSFLLFMGWSTALEAAFGTAGMVLFGRGRPPHAHGDAISGA
jgi:hypothetical protein